MGLILAYLVFCIGFAYLNAKLIEQGKRIYHGLNGAIHLTIWSAIYFITKDIYITISLPFIGRLFFDTALSLFRGLPIGYVSSSPKSIIDKVEKSIFNTDGTTPKIIYLLFIIIILTFRFLYLP